MELSEIIHIFAVEITSKVNNMCTVTLFYDQNNALARRKLAALLATGLFSQQTIDDNEPTPEAIEAHRQERDAFLEHSKKSMSHIIARYL